MSDKWKTSIKDINKILLKDRIKPTSRVKVQQINKVKKS